MKTTINKTIFASCLTVLAFALLSASFKDELGKFGSSTEKTVGPKTIKVPYTDVISYLGFAEVGSEDEIVNGKKFTFIYVWIPAVAPELGVRMMSPVGDYAPKGSTLASNFEANKASNDFFDTYITLEKSTIISPDKISAANVKSATWTLMESNDDSSEMPTQPSGNNYNSLLRVVSESSNPGKALTKGLYRIGFTTFKTGEVQGTFVAEVGSPIKLPGVVINKDLNKIIEATK
jgi:hypothetical protein